MIYEKLFNIQQSLSVPKEQLNDYGNYKYRSCEDILEALKPLLKDHKLVVLFTDSIVVENGRNYIKTNLKLIDAETGESIEGFAMAREEESKKGMDGSQITGASSSYARKYALNGMFAIDDNKDSDTTNKGEDKTEPSAPAKKTDAKKPETKSNDSLKFICSKCKKEIKPYYSDKLKRDVGLREHEEISNKKFGNLFCVECMKKIAKSNADKESKS